VRQHTPASDRTRVPSHRTHRCAGRSPDFWSARVGLIEPPITFEPWRQHVHCDEETLPAAHPRSGRRSSSCNLLNPSSGSRAKRLCPSTTARGWQACLRPLPASEALLSPSFDRLPATTPRRRGTADVDCRGPSAQEAFLRVRRPRVKVAAVRVVRRQFAWTAWIARLRPVLHRGAWRGSQLCCPRLDARRPGQLRWCRTSRQFVSRTTTSAPSAT